MISGGYQIPGEGTGDDSFDEEGYDESQRAEILEATRDGPTDGTILTDLEPDIAARSDDDDEDEDDLSMESDETGELDPEATPTESELDEDDLQDDFDADAVEPDDLSDRDDTALRP